MGNDCRLSFDDGQEKTAGDYWWLMVVNIFIVSGWWLMVACLCVMVQVWNSQCQYKTDHRVWGNLELHLSQLFGSQNRVSTALTADESLLTCKIIGDKQPVMAGNVMNDDESCLLIALVISGDQRDISWIILHLPSIVHQQTSLANSPLHWLSSSYQQPLINSFQYLTSHQALRTID